MGSVSSVVEENASAAGIEEMSATANALHEHAEGLRRVVTAFRIAAG